MYAFYFLVRANPQKGEMDLKNNKKSRIFKWPFDDDCQVCRRSQITGRSSKAMALE